MDKCFPIIPDKPAEMIDYHPGPSILVGHIAPALGFSGTSLTLTLTATLIGPDPDIRAACDAALAAAAGQWRAIGGRRVAARTVTVTVVETTEND